MKIKLDVYEVQDLILEHLEKKLNMKLIPRFSKKGDVKFKVPFSEVVFEDYDNNTTYNLSTDDFNDKYGIEVYLEL